MIADAYHVIATAYHVEASEAGLLLSLPDACIFGMLLGVLYTVYDACISPLLSKKRTKNRALRIAHLALRRAKRRLQRKERRPKKQYIPKSWRKTIRMTLYAVCDILFWLCAAALTAVFFYRAHFGQLRWYLFLMIAVGFSLYKKTVGDRIADTVNGVLALMYPCIALIWTAVTYPLGWVCQKIKKYIKKRKKSPQKISCDETIQSDQTEVKRWTRKKKNRKCQRKRSASLQKPPCSYSSSSAV